MVDSEGQSALFRVALAIFRINEEMILSVDDSLEVFQVVQVSSFCVKSCRSGIYQLHIFIEHAKKDD